MNLSELCRCCHATGQHKSLEMQYTVDGAVETYSLMLRDILSIELLQRDVSNGICEVCIYRLQQAKTFKNQVVQCERKLLEYTNTLDEIQIKEEIINDKVCTSPDNDGCYNNEDMENSDLNSFNLEVAEKSDQESFKNKVSISEDRRRSSRIKISDSSKNSAGTAEERKTAMKKNKENTTKAVRPCNRTKQHSQSLLPPKKRARKDYPVREMCTLVSETAPATKKQPWQMSALIDGYSVMELRVDSNTGELKSPSAPATILLDKDASCAETVTSIDPPDDLQSILNEVSASDDDSDVDADLTHGQTDTYLTSAYFTEDLDENLQEWLNKEDLKSDRHLQRELTTDKFEFDWSCEHESFKGQRETFTGNNGPTFPVTDNTTPLDIFFKYFDDDFFDLIVTQTNKYASGQIEGHSLSAHSRLNNFKNVDKNEIGIFLAILIFQGLVPLHVEKDYWIENGYLTLKYFKNLMGLNRFTSLKRLLYFTDSTDNTQLNLTEKEKELSKIQPVVDMLNKKFSSLYLPGQNINIGEKLLKWKGQKTFAQKGALNTIKNGIKSLELSDLATGYLWKFIISAEKTDREADESTHEPTDSLSGATSKIITDMAEPLFNRGHTLVMDSYYNSPLLARYLKTKGTDCYGPLRANRENFPDALKSVQKSEMRPGDLVQSFTHDLSVVLWRDTELVSLISTYHTGVEVTKGKNRFEPHVVSDYKISMGSVDKRDQVLSSFPMERKRNQMWFKKAFRRLLNCALSNCYIIFKSHSPNATHQWFRIQLAEDLIKCFKPSNVERTLKVSTQKCVITGKKKVRPILSGNHFIGSGTSQRALCCWCKKSRTKYVCKKCEVSLCVLICFEEYHTAPEPRHK